MFEPGISIKPTQVPLGFLYGKNTFGPVVEIRTLDAIRKNLLDSQCDGPNEVYAIAMDVGNDEDRKAIEDRNLLFGVVTYASGKLGREPIRSQGHIHSVSASCGSSTPEVYEIWEGEAFIYMQESANDDPGKCYAIHAKAGDVVIVPPGWAHATISADYLQPLTFGAWCVRDFGFDYEEVRNHHGLAYYPVLNEKHEIDWIKNEQYLSHHLEVRPPRLYEEFGIESNLSIYSQFRKDPDRFLFVADPNRVKSIWHEFKP